MDLLEEYITTGNKEVRNDAQMTDLCDLVDEIRALHPSLPAPDFVERTVKHIAENIPARQPRRKFYHVWFTSAGWASAAVAAILLVSLGVLPQNPSEQLPSVPALPTPPVQQAVPSPDESAQALITPGNTANQKRTVSGSGPENNIAARQENNTARPESVSDAGVKPLPPPGSGSMGRKFAVAEYKLNADNKNRLGEAAAEQASLQPPRALALEPAVDIQDKVPFKVLTVPEQRPVQVKINDRPPGVIMTYKIGKEDIIVRQWIEEATDTAKDFEVSQAVPAPDKAVRVLHDNVIVEVSGNVDRAVLEEFARSFE